MSKRSIWFASGMVEVPTGLANDLLAKARSTGKADVRFTRIGMGPTATYTIKGIHDVKVDLVLFTRMMKMATNAGLGTSGTLLVKNVAIAEKQPGQVVRPVEVKDTAKLPTISVPTTKAPSTIQSSTQTQMMEEIRQSTPSSSPPIVPITSSPQKEGDFVPATAADVEEAASLVEEPEGMSTGMKVGIGLGVLGAIGGVGYLWWRNR